MMGHTVPPDRRKEGDRLRIKSLLDWHPLLAAFSIVAALGLFACLVIRSEESKLEAYPVCSPIARIGGCDKHGRCGVVLANGAKLRHFYPAVGEMVCYRPRKR